MKLIQQIIRRPGGLWAAGTLGWLVCLLYHIWESSRDLVTKNQTTRAADSSSARTVLCLETAVSSRQMAMRLGPGHPLITLPEQHGYILPSRSTRELAQECLLHHGTRRYGEKLQQLPDGSTEDGVGGIPLVSFASGLASLTHLDQMIEARVLAQRDRRRIDAHHESGESFALGARNVQVFPTNGAGGTGIGLILLMASRVSFFCRKHGLPSENILLCSAPSVLSGGDLISARGNYATFLRQVVIAMDQPKQIAFRTLTGERIEHSEPLIHRVISFGPSSGKITVGTREDVAAQMALASWLLLDSPYGPFADAAFRDHDKDRLDTRYGFRGFSRLGVGILRVDAIRNQTIAQASGEALAASELLGTEL